MVNLHLKNIQDSLVRLPPRSPPRSLLSKDADAAVHAMALPGRCRDVEDAVFSVPSDSGHAMEGVTLGGSGARDDLALAAKCCCFPGGCLPGAGCSLHAPFTGWLEPD